MSSEAKKPLVSIGLPVFNRPQPLRNILQVILKQSYQNFEVIISDNASTDLEVRKICEEISGKDSRFKYFYQKTNTGVLENANFVLSKSTGKYFCWISDDDWRSPEFLEYLVKALEDNPEKKFAFCDYYETYLDGTRAKGYPFTHLPIFKKFMSRYSLIRILRYFIQDSSMGKGNLFYALFLREVLETLDLKRISNNYRYLNMDCLVVHQILRKSSPIILQEAMCTLTCGNEKFYEDSKLTNYSKETFLNKLIKFLNYEMQDSLRYFENETHYVEKILMILLTPLKICIALKSLIRRKRLLFKSNNEKEIQNVNKIQLPQVTLIALATRNVEETIKALEYSCRGIEFGEVKLLAHYQPRLTNNKIKFYKVESLKSIDDWCKKIVYELGKYVDTDYALLVHADGFVVNPELWKEEFLEYDYIGAPWPLPTDDFSYRAKDGEIIRVGNSVSLRSKKLIDLPVELNLPWEPDHGYYNEDGFICVKNRHIYKDNGIKFAPIEVAKYFSHEKMIPEIKGIRPFAFHKWDGSNSSYPNFFEGR